MSSIEKIIATNKTEKDLVRSIIESYSFLDYGFVETYSGNKVTVKLLSKRMGQELELRDVELVTLGSQACSIEVEPTKGDLVLLLGLRDYVAQLKGLDKTLDACRLHYNLANVKAVQIAPAQDSKAKIKVNKDGDMDVEAKSINLNGKNNSLTMFAPLSTALTQFINSLVLALTTTPIIGNGSPQATWSGLPTTIDISAAEADTLKTGG